MVEELNPFIYDDPLAPDELIDRDEQTRLLLALAEGGHNTRLSAPRRYGKTSIILRLLAEADRAGLHTVHVDFYRCVTRAEAARRIEEA
ncbi:MAG TPA: AAA-like domain-containing protein, partial [Coriobacteriia bacterium]|nr:AAA-like domain-containing protein [Coriobacteriia bacterium]